MMVHNDLYTDSNLMGLGRSRAVVPSSIVHRSNSNTVKYAALTRALMTLVSVGSGVQRVENTKQTTSVLWCQKSGDCCHMYVCWSCRQSITDRNRANHLQSRAGKQAASDLTLNSKKVRGLTAKLVPVLDLRAYPSPDLSMARAHVDASPRSSS